MLGSPQNCEELLSTMQSYEKHYFGSFGPWNSEFIEYVNIPSKAEADEWLEENRVRKPVRMMQEWVRNAAPDAIEFVVACLQAHIEHSTMHCESIVMLFAEACFTERPDCFATTLLPTLDGNGMSLTSLQAAVIDIAEDFSYMPAVPYMERMHSRLIGDAKQYVEDRLRGLESRG